MNPSFDPWRWLPALAAALAPLTAATQHVAPTRPDPSNPAASAPPLVHRSALSTYRRLTVDNPPVAWRDANDQVERIGGWRAYAREANAPAPAASAPAAPASSPQAPRPATPAHRH